MGRLFAKLIVANGIQHDHPCGMFLPNTDWLLGWAPVAQSVLSELVSLLHGHMYWP